MGLDTFQYSATFVVKKICHHNIVIFLAVKYPGRNDGKFRFLRPSELDGRSINAVEQSQNFLSAILKMWATFSLLIYTNKNISIYMHTSIE